MEPLKACPFCGGLPIAVDPDDNEGAYGFHGMACEGCGAQVDDETPELVAGKWNRRTPDPGALYAAYHALTIGGWSVVRASLYRDEGIEGWIWRTPAGDDYHEVGSWEKPPPWPSGNRRAPSPDVSRLLAAAKEALLHIQALQDGCRTGDAEEELEAAIARCEGEGRLDGPPAFKVVLHADRIEIIRNGEVRGVRAWCHSHELWNTIDELRTCFGVTEFILRDER